MSLQLFIFTVLKDKNINLNDKLVKADIICQSINKASAKELKESFWKFIYKRNLNYLEILPEEHNFKQIACISQKFAYFEKNKMFCINCLETIFCNLCSY